jgi:ribosomal protein S17
MSLRFEYKCTSNSCNHQIKKYKKYLEITFIVFTFVEIFCNMADEVVIQETRDVDKEIGFTPWLGKVVERCTLALLCMKEKQDNIQEFDYDILKALHGVWFNGEIPIFQTITIPVKTEVTQTNLFTDNMSENSNNYDDARDKILDGKEFDTPPVKPIKSKKK